MLHKITSSSASTDDLQIASESCVKAFNPNPRLQIANQQSAQSTNPRPVWSPGNLPPSTASRSVQFLDEADVLNLFRNTLGLRYHIDSDQFELQVPGQSTGTILSPNQMLMFVSNTLAQQHGIIPADQLRPRNVKRLLSTLRALCAWSGNEPSEGLQRFITTCLVRQPGCDITSCELWDAYLAFLDGNGGTALSAYQFHRQLPGHVKRRFGIAKRHEILRPLNDGRLTKRNGWRGLKLANRNDTNDSTDANDGILQNPPNTGPQENL